MALVFSENNTDKVSLSVGIAGGYIPREKHEQANL